MYEKMTYEYLMKRALARVPDNVDKRQGSIIWDALAPACAELAQMYIEADNILKLTYAESSFGTWLSRARCSSLFDVSVPQLRSLLDKRCSEMGVYREPGTSAIRLGLFYTGNNQNRQPFDVPIDSRYSIETVNYIVVERIKSGQFKLQCEEMGIIGNKFYGRLTPIETIRDLSYAELADVLIPGEDEEKDNVFYARYVEAVNATPFGGNIADYKMKVKAIEGIGGCKVFPVRRGGGTVDVSIISSEFEPPSQTLIADVQERLDPEPFHQLGMGLAPIGHYVLVSGVEGVEINLSTVIQLKKGISIGQIEDDIYESIRAYLHELAVNWEEAENIIVRINQLESRILSVDGLIDLANTTLNGLAENIMLAAEQIPTLGRVVLRE